MRREIMDDLKIPPCDIDAERSILGITIIDNSKFMDVVDYLSESDFYDRSHGLIYKTMKEMVAENIPVDFVSLKNKLLSDGKLENAGGVSLVAKLADDIASPANMEHYAYIVKEKARLRKLIEIGNNLAAKGYEGIDKSEDIKNEGFRHLIKIGEDKKRRIASIDENLDEIEKEIVNKAGNPERYGGVYTGLSNFDSLTNGFERQEIVIIGGYPCAGKTALMMSLANYIGVQKLRGVLIFSLDQSFKVLQKRLLAQLSHVNSEVFKKGTTDEKLQKKIKTAMELLKDIPIYVDDNSMDIDVLYSLAHKYCAMHSIKVIFIDYVQRLKRKGRNEYESVTESVKKAKDLAKELDLVVILLSQFHRGQEKEAQKPKLSFLRGSGVIEEEANYVIFPYDEMALKKEKREDFIKEKYEDIALMDLILAKNKEGPTGDVKVRFLKEYGLFDCLEE